MPARLLRSFLLGLALATSASAGSARVGAAAPAFSLPDWHDRPVALADFRGQVVCLDFWASWCAVCRQALPALDAIAARHRTAGLTVLAVNIDRNRTDADRFLTERLPAPAVTLLRDPEGAVMARFGADGMPALYLVDREGIVRTIESGYAPERLDAVERTIDELLATPRPGDTPPPN
jgi:thiol-disulfide isomerase/thioredoxin